MHPRRFSQVERAVTVLERSGISDMIKDSPHLLSLFKRTERVAAALFILTNPLPEAEPVKWELRSAGTALMCEALVLGEDASVMGREFTRGSFRSATRVLALLELAYISGLVSPMNFSLLAKEIEGLFAAAEGRWEGEEATLPRSLFEERAAKSHAKKVQDTRDTGAPATRESVAENKTQVKDTGKGHSAIKDSVHYHLGEGVEVGKVWQKMESGVLAEPKKRSISTMVSDRLKVERKQVIIALLRKKDSATITDFVSLIQGCSGKTVQRLLLDLVGQGVLYRLGKRRWSRYSLVKTELSVPTGSSQ